MRVVEVMHVGFLRHITINFSRRQYNGTWETPAAEEVLRTEGMQLAAKYIGLQQATVVQWVALRALPGFCVREKFYQVGGRKQIPLWSQVTNE